MTDRRSTLTMWATFAAFWAGVVTVFLAVVGVGSSLDWFTIDRTEADIIGGAIILAVAAWAATIALAIARGSD